MPMIHSLYRGKRIQGDTTKGKPNEIQQIITEHLSVISRSTEQKETKYKAEK